MHRHNVHSSIHDISLAPAVDEAKGDKRKKEEEEGVPAVYSSRAVNILTKLGWKGEGYGIGKAENGSPDPVALAFVDLPQGRAGLGWRKKN